MLADHFEKSIIEKLEEEPTNGQKLLIKQVSGFILNSPDDEVFVVTGYAGTGKTTVIAAIINVLGDYKTKTVLLAPTGRASKVLANFSGKPAYTIHKKIYKQKSSKDGFGKFVLGKNLTSGIIFFIDEASMISGTQNELSVFGSGNLLDDLLEYVYNGTRCKLILIGDPAQLPPVNFSESPALYGENIKSKGFTVSSTCLTDVVRQSKTSGILFNATLTRKLIAAGNPKIPKFKVDGFADVIRLSGSDLINELDSCYGKYGIEETIVVTRSNKRANIYNKGVRASVLFRDEQISVGDYLMVVKNNYFWLANDEELNFIANGDIMQVVRIGKHEEKYGFHFVNVKIRLLDIDNREIDVKIILETLEIEGASLSSEDNKKLFYSVYEDFQHLKPKQAGYVSVRSNPYFNALQVKFAYAVTCHKAQGGQWKAVFIDQGYFTPDMLNLEYLRWLYTAITRASQKLYLVNFTKDFFENEQSEK
jgi:exodeoxyribonuclease-5